MSDINLFCAVAKFLAIQGKITRIAAIAAIGKYILTEIFDVIVLVQSNASSIVFVLYALTYWLPFLRC